MSFFLLTAVALLFGTPALAADQPTKRPPWTTSRIHGTPTPPEPYQIVPAFPNLKFQLPTSIEEFSDGKRLLVTEMGGKIFSFAKDAAVNNADLVGDLAQLLPQQQGNVRLFDAEFHPRFSENRYLFVCYAHPGNGGHTRVSRFTLTTDAAPKLVGGSEQVIITWPTGGHNAGCLEFGTDGYLYIATGDGSGPNPPDGLTTGQDVSDLLGAILRIDIDHPTDKAAYSVPKDNPFVALAGARPEIWAYGLRNPWKFGIDPETNQIFAADNGWETWEMIHRIERGRNCGWPVMEGRVALRSEVKVGPTPIVPPVKDHPHTEANSVIGGPVYRGQKLPDLVGSFVYGDYITGTIWAIKADRDGSYSSTTLVDTDQRIVAFTQASTGELYVLDYDYTGQIYELLPSGLKDTSATFPRKLSQTGLFSQIGLRYLIPAPGVIRYDVTIERWMDNAYGERFVAIPGDGAIQLADGESTAKYPEGTVFAKQVLLPQFNNTPSIRLETQILHYERGTWRPYSYLWDDAGTDATLVEPEGTSRPLATTNGVIDHWKDTTWHVNATNECKLCHNAGPKFVLGFTANQLSRLTAGPVANAHDQLPFLVAQGVLNAAPTVASVDGLRLVPNYETTKSLDDRARSYLHVNCSMCHHPGGNAIVSFYLRRDLPFDKLNTNKGTGIGTFGMRDAKIIVPGDPYRSILMYRMSKLGYARMPYIGSRVVDSDGVALIEEWIRSLPGASAASAPAPTQADSAEAKALALLQRETATAAEREAAVKTLLQTTEGSLALALQIHRRPPAPREENHPTERDVYDTAVALGNATPSSDRRGLFETFIPESKRRPTLGPNIDPNVILNRQGDAERGKLIFFSDGARCRNCHEIDDRSKSLGPTLMEIKKKFPKTAEMLPHVLQPSLKIDEPFAAYTIVTDDGRVLSGLVIEQNDNEIVLKTAEKQVARLARKNIEEQRRNDKSLMPERILSDLTAQEAADLLEYIRTR